MLKLRKNKKGFTLVELIVVIAIMAVLAGTVAGVTVTQLNKNTDKAAGTQTKGVADFLVADVMDGTDIAVKKNDATAPGTDHSATYDTVISWAAPTGTWNATDNRVDATGTADGIYSPLYAIKLAIEKQYPSITFAYNDPSGEDYDAAADDKLSLGKAAYGIVFHYDDTAPTNNMIIVVYNGKQNGANGDIAYSINSEGVVNKVDASNYLAD